MKVQVNRRKAMKWLFSAPIGNFSAGNLSKSTPVSDSASNGVIIERLRSRIQQAVARGEATGVAVAVVQGGRIVWEEGFGWADREQS